MDNKQKQYLKVGTDALMIEILSEPFVIYTQKGYFPVVEVLESRKQQNYLMFISAQSLSRQLHKLAEENGGLMKGLEFWIRKESEDRMAPYILESL